MIIVIHFVTTVALTFLATVRWVRFGDDKSAGQSQTEQHTPSWARL